MVKKIKIFSLVISPLIVGCFSLFIGAYHLSPIIVIKIIFNEIFKLFDIDNVFKAIVLDIRLPRILLAGVVGSALSGAGVALQGIFRNPLVDPYILGISAGAAFGCSLTVGFLPSWSIQIMAFLFALVSVALAYIVAMTQEEVSRLSLILSGVIVSAFFQALVSIIKFLVDPHKLQAIVFWLMGSFSLADWKTFKIALIGISIGLLPLFLMRWRLNILSLPEEEAKALGINVKREKIIFVVFSTLSVATATSVCGIIGWVGLMIPHLVRMAIGPDHKLLFPLSLTTGAAFMIGADTISRTITTFDVPVGIITALTGAPFFMYLMKRGGKEAWGK